MFIRQMQEMFYKRAKTPKDLPWHRDAPDGFVQEVVETRARPGRALDLGCGSGVFSVWLARNGYEVTGVDLIPRAIDMSTERAKEEGVQVNWVRADLLSWTAPGQFDVIVDSGCLHSLIGGDVRRYKEQLLRWLAPEGDYVLGHFGKRHWLDWRPVGPKRRTREQLVRLFVPPLELVKHKQSEMAVPLPIGPIVQGHAFWFRRKGTSDRVAYPPTPPATSSAPHSAIAG
jgi:SAM-dependent methyltransferase